MEKLAQQIGFLDKAREIGSIKGQWLELTQPEIKSIMNELRSADNTIRDLVLGKNKLNKSLKELIKEAEKNFNRREYLVSLSEIVDFYQLILDLEKELNSLNIDFIKSHYELLSQKLSPEAKEKLLSLKSTFASKDYSIIKQSGLLDTLYNIFSSRGRSLATLEKRFPRSVKHLKNTNSILLKSCTGLYNNIINSLNKMKDCRVKRDVEGYLIEKNRLINYINSFESQFKSYYNSNLKQIINRLEPAFSGEEINGEIEPTLPTNIAPVPNKIDLNALPVIDVAEITPSNDAEREQEEDKPLEKKRIIPKNLFEEIDNGFDKNKDDIEKIKELCKIVSNKLSSFDVNSEVENYINYLILCANAANAINSRLNEVINDVSDNEVKNKIIQNCSELLNLHKNTFENLKSLNDFFNSGGSVESFKTSCNKKISETNETIKNLQKNIESIVEIDEKGDETVSVDVVGDASVGAKDEQQDKVNQIEQEIDQYISQFGIENIAINLKNEFQRIVESTSELNIDNIETEGKKLFEDLSSLKTKLIPFLRNASKLNKDDPAFVLASRILKAYEESPIAIIKDYSLLSSLDDDNKNKIIKLINKSLEKCRSIFKKIEMVREIPKATPTSTTSTVQPIITPEKNDFSGLAQVQLDKLKINFYNNLNFKDKIEYSNLTDEEEQKKFIIKKIIELNPILLKEVKNFCNILNIDTSSIPTSNNPLELFIQLSELKNKYSLQLSKQTIKKELETTSVIRKNNKITIPEKVKEIIDLVASIPENSKISEYEDQIKECVFGIQDVIDYLVSSAEKIKEYKDYYNKYDIYNCLASIIEETIKNNKIKLHDYQKEILKNIFTKDYANLGSLVARIGGSLRRTGEIELTEAKEIKAPDDKLIDVPESYLEPKKEYEKIISTNNLESEFNQLVEFMISTLKQNKMPITVATIIRNKIVKKDLDFRLQFLSYLNDMIQGDKNIAVRGNEKLKKDMAESTKKLSEFKIFNKE